MQSDDITRREALGWLAWLTAGPRLAGISAADPVGAVRRFSDRASKLAQPLAGFQETTIEWNLIADRVAEVEKWVTRPNLKFFYEQLYFSEVPKLIDRGVSSVAEFYLCRKDRGFLNLQDYCVEVSVMTGTAHANAQMRRFDAMPAEAGYAPLVGHADEAVVSTGGWSLAGKIFFRQANVLGSVCPHLNTDVELAQQIADKICSFVENNCA